MPAEPLTASADRLSLLPRISQLRQRLLTPASPISAGAADGVQDGVVAGSAVGVGGGALLAGTGVGDGAGVGDAAVGDGVGEAGDWAGVLSGPGQPTGTTHI
jgi:hypothetical protein